MVDVGHKKATQRPVNISRSNLGDVAEEKFNQTTSRSGRAHSAENMIVE